MFESQKVYSGLVCQMKDSCDWFLKILWIFLVRSLRWMIKWQMPRQDTYTLVVGDCRRGQLECSLFNSYYTKVVGEGTTPFPWLLHFTLDPYLIMLSIKQGSLKYHFLSLWYDSTWDWTSVSWAIGEHSTN